MLSTIVIFLSSVSLLHSAYLAWLARQAVLHSGEVPELTLGSPVPVPVIAQTLGSFVVLSLAILWSAPALKGVTWANEMSSRTIDQEVSLSSFGGVRHRGGVVFRERD
ncbi:hypothetical protein JCM10212_000388 [Sporobolomyces blumeae]